MADVFGLSGLSLTNIFPLSSGTARQLALKSKMLKVYILSRRRSDLTHQQYLEHWRDVHAKLFSSQPDTKRYVRRYIQSRVTDDRPNGFVLGEVDGIVQLWFDDIDEFNSFFNSQSYRDVIRPDEERFTDPKRCEFFFSNEYLSSTKGLDHLATLE